jgi:hypothetical protein
MPIVWGRDFDVVCQMKLWMIAINIASRVDAIDANAKKEVLEAKSGMECIYRTYC